MNNFSSLINNACHNIVFVKLKRSEKIVHKICVMWPWTPICTNPITPMTWSIKIMSKPLLLNQLLMSNSYRYPFAMTFLNLKPKWCYFPNLTNAGFH